MFESSGHLVICVNSINRTQIILSELVIFQKPYSRGVAMIFQRGGGGHTVSNIIVMAFSPRNIVGCLLNRGLQGGGGGVTGTPGSPPSLRPGTP